VRRAAGVYLAALFMAVLTGSSHAALRLDPVARGFDSPVFLGSTPTHPNRLFVVEQRGVVKIIQSGSVRSTPFLDIRDLVRSPKDGGGGEQGLLSLAFDPNYGTNRRFFVYFTNVHGDIRIVSFRVNRAFSRAVRSTFRRWASVAHPPATNHNGGQVAFGPGGYLYFATGDGGGGCDPGDRAQTRSSRLGKLLRLNVSVSGANPVQVGYGLRNPWRFSFDPATRDLYVADVGQNTWEEINRTRYGATGVENYGWNEYEGPYRIACDSGDRLNLPSGTYHKRPIHWYSHSVGCSVTGGYVYRGERIAQARGRYFFGDYCSGRVWSFVIRNGRKEDFGPHPNLTVSGNLSSFGVGPRGSLYLVSHNGGRIYRLASA
jgi:glucose/arabinose dehydrogenase